MNVAGAISSLGGAPLSVTRRGAGTYVNGRPVPGASSSTEVTALVQPATPNDLQKLPEGRRTERTIAIWSQAELFVPGASGGVSGDLVTYCGETYEVQAVEPWGAYWRALAVRISP